MESFYLVVFRSLPITEGHFLWPKYQQLGKGFFLCRVPEAFLQSCNGPSREESTIQLVEQILGKFLYDQNLGACEPVSVFPVKLEDHLPTPIRDALIRLQAFPKDGYFFSVDPPPSMSLEERSVYKQFDFGGRNN